MSALLVHYSLVKKKKKNTQQLRKACHALQCSVKLWSLQIFRWLDLFSHHTYRIQLRLLPSNLVCQETCSLVINLKRQVHSKNNIPYTHIYTCVYFYTYLCVRVRQRETPRVSEGALPPEGYKQAAAWLAAGGEPALGAL